MNEADTCREYVRPKSRLPVGTRHPIPIKSRRRSPDGRIVCQRGGTRFVASRRSGRISCSAYTRDVPLDGCRSQEKIGKEPPGTGLQQAKEYAEILGLRFALLHQRQGNCRSSTT